MSEEQQQQIRRNGRSSKAAPTSTGSRVEFRGGNSVDARVRKGKTAAVGGLAAREHCDRAGSSANTFVCSQIPEQLSGYGGKESLGEK
jgi:hypothetical protein